MDSDTTCDWRFPDGTPILAQNAGIIVVAGYFPGPWGPVKTPDPVTLNGDTQLQAALTLIPTASAALILRAKPGKNQIATGGCKWTVRVGDLPDHTPPHWVEPLTEIIVPRQPKAESGFSVWDGALDETAWLLAWAPEASTPSWIVPPRHLGGGLRFAVRAHSEDLPNDPTLVMAHDGRTVIRPMDASGNLGDAYQIDYATSAVTHIDDPSSYRWDAYTSLLESWQVAPAPSAGSGGAKP